MMQHGFREITLSINGRQRTLYIDIKKSLAEILREELSLNGVKQGCGVGECGACSVLIDDVLVDSCIYLAIWADNKNIRTIEGEAKKGKLSKVQQAYVDEGAIQCGFCTPGFVMATTSFKEKCKTKGVTKDITEDEIRKEHAGNLCRCTGYQNILKAVEKSMES